MGKKYQVIFEVEAEQTKGFSQGANV